MFALSDLFVMTAANENFGLVINEAMCAGLPVVASTGIGAARDLVRNGENGRIFEVGDLASLADALRAILVDPVLRERMGRASKEISASGGCSGWPRHRPQVSRRWRGWSSCYRTESAARTSRWLTAANR